MLILPIKRKKKENNLVVSHYFGHHPPDQGSNKALSYSTISRDHLFWSVLAFHSMCPAQRVPVGSAT